MITVQIETAKFNAALAQYAKASKKSAGEVVRRACVFVAKAFMVSTQPRSNANESDGNFRKKKGEVIYNGKADQALGKTAVMRDIGKVFSPHQQAFNEIKETSRDAAKGYAKAVANGDFDEAERILKSTGKRNRNAEVGDLDPKMHKESKRGGRVKRQRIARFIDRKELAEYSKEIANRVGFAKSAWFHLGLKFGKMTNVPAWIKRHAAPGMAIDSTNSKNPGGSMTSLVRYASQILPESKQSESMKYARQRMTSMMEAELKHNANKARLNRK
jgi:hypothetical protein